MTPWWNGSRCGATRRTLIARTAAVLLVARTPGIGSFAGPGAVAGAQADVSPQTDAADSDRAERD